MHSNEPDSLSWHVAFRPQSLASTEHFLSSLEDSPAQAASRKTSNTTSWEFRIVYSFDLGLESPELPRCTVKADFLG